MALLTVSGINKHEKGNYSVKDIYFDQQPLQKIAIAGETGSGKTTLLKMIAGWIQPDEGEMRFRDERILGPFEQLIPGRKEIAYLSQHFELRNNYWVYEILEYANELSQTEANTIYTVCRIEHLLKRRTDQLSGGEKQRIALARLLTSSPQLLLLDEPFSNLDMTHKNIIKSVITDIGNKLNITCILVSHDALDVLSWAETVLVMKEGQIIQQGTPEQVYRQPLNSYCAGLLGAFNMIDMKKATAFSNLPGINPTAKQILIRPEHVLIETTGKPGLRGIVQNSLFWGNYYTVDVMVDQDLIRVQTSNNLFATGEEVFLSFEPEYVWYPEES